MSLPRAVEAQHVAAGADPNYWQHDQNVLALELISDCSDCAAGAEGSVATARSLLAACC